MKYVNCMIMTMGVLFAGVGQAYGQTVSPLDENAPELPDVTVSYCSQDQLDSLKAFMMTKLVETKKAEYKMAPESSEVTMGDLIIMACSHILAEYTDKNGKSSGGFEFFDVQADVAYINNGKVVVDIFGGVVSLIHQDLRNDAKESAGNPLPQDTAPKAPPTGVFEGI